MFKLLNNHSSTKNTNLEPVFAENIPTKVSPFIGASKFFNELNDFLNLSNQIKLLVVQNPENLNQRGLGKTTALIEYCHLVKENLKINIRWLNGGTHEKFEKSLNYFSMALKVNNQNTQETKSYLQLINESVQQSSIKKLYIITNLYDFQTIKNFLINLKKKIQR